MHLDALTELENWLEFPINYAEGIALLSEQTTSPSYATYVGRVADAALKSSEDIASDVGAYLATHPRRVRTVAKAATPVQTAQIVAAGPSSLSRRCLYCSHNEFYHRSDSRMTHNGMMLFIFLLIMAFPFAFIPYFFMREKHYTEFCKVCNRKQDID